MGRVCFFALLLPLLARSQAVEKEMALGRQLASAVESHEKLISDPVIAEYMNRIGHDVALHSGMKIPLVIKVIAGGEPRAVILPGGTFYLSAKLVLTANSEDELAGAIAHGLGHIAVWHRTGRPTDIQFALMASNSAPFWGSLCVRGSPMLPMILIESQPNAESQADLLGLGYLDESGYDPMGLADFYERILAQDHRQPSVLMPWSAFPASTRSRAGSLRNNRSEYLVTTSEFRDIQRRLMAPQPRAFPR